MNQEKLYFEITIKATGAFYITFEYSDDFDLEVEDANIGYSYLSLGAVKHELMESSLYAKTVMIPEESESVAGEWCCVEKLTDQFDGMRLWYVL